MSKTTKRMKRGFGILAKKIKKGYKSFSNSRFVENEKSKRDRFGLDKMNLGNFGGEVKSYRKIKKGKMTSDPFDIDIQIR